jgi:protein phosphatase
MKAYGISCVGQVRKSNEDSYIVLSQKGIFAVADGMGGHRAGEVASRIAVQALEEKAEELVRCTENEAADLLVEGIHNANIKIMREGISQEINEGMGTTFSALVIKGCKGIIGHVGDSRVYLWRGKTLMQLTEDHSVVAELVRVGQLTEEQARDHPNRNMLSRALGMGMELRVDCQQIIISPGDMFLLTTDGVTNMVNDDEIAQLLAEGGELTDEEEAPENNPWQLCLERLSQMITDRGATDNFTLIFCTVEPSDLAGMSVDEEKTIEIEENKECDRAAAEPRS